MNTKDNFTPYESPISVCVRLNLAGIVCQSGGTAGQEVPSDPGHDGELDTFDNTIFNIPVPGDDLLL